MDVARQAATQETAMPRILMQTEGPEWYKERLALMYLFGPWIGDDEMALALDFIREVATTYVLPPPMMWHSTILMGLPATPFESDNICFTIHYQAHWIGVVANYRDDRWYMGYIGATRQQADTLSAELRTVMPHPGSEALHYTSPIVSQPHLCGWQVLRHWSHLTEMPVHESQLFAGVVAHLPQDQASAVTRVTNQVRAQGTAFAVEPHLRDFIYAVRQRTAIATLHVPPCTSVVFGGAKPHPNHQPLKDLLLKHGVPQENVQKRIEEIHSKLSQAAVQQALHAKNPWAHLKKAAQDVDLRLVKKEELQHHIEQRQFQGAGKNQKAPAKQWHLPKAGDLQIMPGWISHADGTPADQIHMQGINATSTGLAFVDSAAVEPWLERRGKHPHPLLLLITGPTSTSHSLPEAQVPAIFLPTQEKILLTCGFLQLGPADKALKLRDTTKVDLNLQGQARLAPR